mmetsp:Transcript_8768/g.22331  ORF Transcript_8768/g.22331 Transcript_8768/m.22331 type:complete len:481 (+) Transcript_8768:506-1948(+)
MYSAMAMEGSLLAVCCEGVGEVSRVGELSVLQLCAYVPSFVLRAFEASNAGNSFSSSAAQTTKTSIGGGGSEGGEVVGFVFDLRASERVQICAQLRLLLADPTVRKVVHLCAGLSDAMLEHMGAELGPTEATLDIALAHKALEAKAEAGGYKVGPWEFASVDEMLAAYSLSTEEAGDTSPAGLSSLTSTLAADTAFAVARTCGPLRRGVQTQAERAPRLWAKRPLSRLLVRFAAAESACVLALGFELGRRVAGTQNAQLEQAYAARTEAALGARAAEFSAKQVEELAQMVGQRVRAHVLCVEPEIGALLLVSPGVSAQLGPAELQQHSGGAGGAAPLREGSSVECTLLAVCLQTRRAHVRLARSPEEPSARFPPSPKVLSAHCSLERPAHFPPAPGMRFAGEVALFTGSGCLLHVPQWPALLVHAHLPSLFAKVRVDDGLAGARELLFPGACVRAEVLCCEGAYRVVHTKLLLPVPPPAC